MIGERFGRLIIIKEQGRTKDRHILWACMCDCGNQTVTTGKLLRKGETKSCGCLQKDTVSTRNLKHGFSKRIGRTSLYKIWCDMKKRCQNKNHWAFDRYGGRGIDVCLSWSNDFQNFFNDMNLHYEEHLRIHGKTNTTLERINNDLGYSPQNCKWATRQEQSKNRSICKKELFS